MKLRLAALLKTVEPWAVQLAVSAAIVVVGALVAVVVRAFIVRRLRARLERLDSVEHFDAVPTQSPFDDPLKVALGQARQSLQSRYSILNRISTAGFILVASVVAIFPLLDTMPKAIVSALVAIVAAVLGIAAKPFVENLISGVVISFSSQFRLGDTVILDDKHYGTLEDITMTHTVIKLWDWRRQILPNSVMLQKDFTNLSHKDAFLWAYVEFQVDYAADLELVERIAVQGALTSKYNAAYEPPQVWLRDLQAGTVKLWLAAWADSVENAWYLRSDLRRGIMLGFQKHGIRSHLHYVDTGGQKVGPPTDQVTSLDDHVASH